MTSDLLNVVVTDCRHTEIPAKAVWETTQHMGVRTVRAGRAGLGGLVLVRRAGVGAGRAASLHQASSSRHSDVRNNTSSCRHCTTN